MEGDEPENSSPGRVPFVAPGLATYYTLIATETVSLIGSQISGLAVSISVFGRTGHATPLALVAFFYTAPQVLAQGFGGALADRFDRRALMLIANLGFALCGGLLLLSFTGRGLPSQRRLRVLAGHEPGLRSRSGSEDLWAHMDHGP
jgi:MFS family permease